LGAAVKKKERSDFRKKRVSFRTRDEAMVALKHAVEDSRRASERAKRLTGGDEQIDQRADKLRE